MSEQGEPRNPEQLQEVEIPLAFRLAHLGIDTAAVYPKLTAQQIANDLDIDSVLVRRALKKFDIEAESMFHEHQKDYFDHYPQYAVELLREERAWREWYLSFPQRVHAKQVAEAIGRSYGWTAKTLAELYPNVRQRKDGHKSRFYPRVAMQKLRDMTFATPPDENWPTIPRLVEFAGRDRTWVLNRLAQTSIRPERRRQAITGREFPHYPPDTFDVLQEFIDTVPPPAGNWLTAYAIQNILGKSGSWVTSRLEESYLSTGEPRLDDMGVERMHYPPETVLLLRDELEQLHVHQPAGEWVTISKLKMNLGVHAVTLAKLMNQVEVESEIRLDLKNRPKLHFSPETQARLAEKAMEVYGYPEAGDWVTFTVAQKIIGRSAGWVRAQLSERGIVPEVRLDKSRHPMDHFDIKAIEEIKALADTLDAGSMITIDDMVERTKKSRTWVVSQLERLQAVPKKRFSGRGKFIDHYEPSVLDDLVRQLV